jgi:hypothetical protein
MIKKIIFIIAMFSFIVIAVGTNAFSQSDKFQKRQESTAKVVNMTDEMKFLCIKIDASGAIDQIKDKEHQAQCEEFLDNVSIYELKELINKYLQ